MSQPTVIASSRPIFGQSLRDKSADFECMEIFSTPDAIERWIEGMVGAGVRAIIAPLDERLLSVLRRQRNLNIEVIPLVPNVSGLVREATEYGMMGAGMRLVWRLGIGTMIRLGLRSIPKAGGVLKRDFPTMLSVLFDLELSIFRAFKPKTVLLHPQITDLLLAMGNKDFFEHYASQLKTRFKVEPGVATNNFGTLARQFDLWKTPIRTIMTPINESGWVMKPDRQACESWFHNDRYTIIADRIAEDPPPSPEDLNRLTSFSAVKSAVVDVMDWHDFNARRLPA